MQSKTMRCLRNTLMTKRNMQAEIIDFKIPKL